MTEIKQTFDGFNRVFEQNIKKAKSYKEAYEKAEESHEAIFGNRCYNSYDSFRHTRHKKIRK